MQLVWVLSLGLLTWGLEQVTPFGAYFLYFFGLFCFLFFNDCISSLSSANNYQ